MVFEGARQIWGQICDVFVQKQVKFLESLFSSFLSSLLLGNFKKFYTFPTVSEKGNLVFKGA
jgi:hypothetical protein